MSMERRIVVLAVIALGVGLTAAPLLSQTQSPSQGRAVDGSPAWFLQGSFPDPTGRTIVDRDGRVTIPPRGGTAAPNATSAPTSGSPIVDTPPCRRSPLC